MNPIIEQFITGDKGAGYELLEAIRAASANHQSGIQIHQCRQDEPAQDVRKVAARTKARDVTQRRKGYVQFIF